MTKWDLGEIVDCRVQTDPPAQFSPKLTVWEGPGILGGHPPLHLPGDTAPSEPVRAKDERGAGFEFSGKVDPHPGGW